eukprot:1156395-Pelagomonas_calceolata.AAC.6
MTYTCTVQARARCLGSAPSLLSESEVEYVHLRLSPSVACASQEGLVQVWIHALQVGHLGKQGLWLDGRCAVKTHAPVLMLIGRCEMQVVMLHT